MEVKAKWINVDGKQAKGTVLFYVSNGNVSVTLFGLFLLLIAPL